MEENQNIGDPLQDLYNEFNSKLKLAKDYNEFKSVMQDPSNRKAFFDEFNPKLKLAKDYNEFDSVLGLKKKELSLPSGEVSSLSELPSEFIAPLKKGISPNQAKEEKLNQLPIIDDGTHKTGPSQVIGGMTIPTNLPKQEQLKYENKLKVDDAAVNTLIDIYNKKGLKFDPSKPAAQKQIQEYIDKEKNNDLVRVTGKDGKEYLTRGQGFGEATLRTFGRSLKDPFESSQINFTNNPSELADLLDEKAAEEPNVPESAPSKFGGYLGGLVGGLPKMAALLAIPYAGESAMVIEMYHNAMANQRKELYQRGLDQGMSREQAAKKAMETAPTTAIPDAVLGYAMAKGVGTRGAKNILPETAKKSFIDAAGKLTKEVGAMSGMGFAGETGRGILTKQAGYDITKDEILQRGLSGASEWGLMHAAFKLMHVAPKAIVSAAKNLLSHVPEPILKAESENYPDGEQTLAEVGKFANTKTKVADFVPENKVAAVTGLTEKTDNLKKDIEALEQNKKVVPPSVAVEIDNQIKDKNKEVEFYDKQIKKVIDSKSETGIDEEVDDITGKKIGTKTYIVDGKEVSQSEFEAMQGKPLGTKEIVKTEVKPTAVDVVGVFHGTNEDFTEFKTNGLGVHFGTESQAKERGSRLVKADITLKKPFRMDDMGSDFDVARLADELLDAGLVTKEKKSDLQKNGTPKDIKNILKENGYDGIVYKNKNEDKLNPKDSYIVFDKSQIKEVKPTEVKDGFDYVRNKFIEDISGGKRLSDKESNILNKEVDKLIERAEKENGVKRNELKQSTWETNDGYTVTEFFENGRGGTRITTPKGEEINIFDNKYKGESGKDISYFPKAAEVKPTEEVKSVKLTDLPDRAFAVGMTVEKFEDLKSKIQKEGFTQPIIIDKESGNVLDGQNRLFVAKDLGIKDVPSIYMNNPTRADLNEKIKELEKQYIPIQEVKTTEVKVESKPIEETKKIIEEVAQKNPEKIANATSKIFKDAGYHRGTLPDKSDYVSMEYHGELPYTGYYFVSNPKDVVQGGSRKGLDDKAFKIVDFSKYNLFKPEDANSYFGTNRGLKKLANDLENGVDAKEAISELLKNHNVSNTLKNKIKKFNDSESFEIEREINKYEKLAETVKSNREFNQINNELDLLYKKLKSVKKELFSDNLNNVLEEYKNDRKSKDFSDRLETKILKSLGYEGVDVRGIKAEGGLKSPDDFSHGSVIFDLKPETVTTIHEAYHNALEIPEEKRTEKQKDLIKSIDDILNKKEEVKPTEAKTASLEEEYDSKSVDELIALKKKLYPSPDIESPMTPDEKLLDRVIAKKFSEKQQEIISKRKAAAEKAPIKEKEKVEITKDDLKIAEAKFAVAEDRFKKARNKIEATQVKQAGMFGGEQKGMFAMGGEEAKKTLEPLRKAAKEAKAELDNVRNRIKVQEEAQPELKPIEEETPYQKALKEKQQEEKKRNREIGSEKAVKTKEIFRKLSQTDRQLGTDEVGAQEIALRYLADGGMVSENAINEAYGTVKRAELNTGRKEVRTTEVRAKDYVGGKETLEGLAHRLWEANNQRVPEDLIRDALMSEIGSSNTRLEAAEAYLEQYSAEYMAEKEEMRLAEQEKEMYLEEQEKLEEELREPLNQQIEGEASEEHVNNLIDQYESEIKGEDQQFGPESEREINKEAGKGKVSEKVKSEEKGIEDVTKNEKRKKINANLEELLNQENLYKKFKIKSKCL